MKKTFTILALLLSIIFINAQSVQKESGELPYIEVMGTAEKKVVPDQIFIAIILKDKVVNKETYTVGAQEEKLIQSLRRIGLDPKNLSLSGASNEVIMRRRKEKGVEEKKEFVLMVSTAEEVGRLFEELHNINIKEAYISHTDHSQMESLRKEVRINAIKAAKDKAAYLLQAIGEEPGKPLVVTELEANPYRERMSNVSFGVEILPEVEFEQMVIKFSYYVKFSIK